MIDYRYQDLFLIDGIDKQLKITYDGGEITNEDIFAETMEITESICSDEQIMFGNCEASVFKITVANLKADLEGKWITVSVVLDGKTDEPFVYGTYKVASFRPTADRSRREIIAYDAIKDILEKDVTTWYRNLPLPMSLKSFRNRFFLYLGITQEVTDLVNDDMLVERTIETDQISGKEIIYAICEINGCFGNMSRDNKFRYLEIAFNQFGLYPKNTLYPSSDIFPVNPTGKGVPNNTWISCEHEDFLIDKFDSLQIRGKENDIGAIVGYGNSNTYVIQDNFLVYGKNADTLRTIAENVFDLIGNFSQYRPFSALCLGNPCLEVGDSIRIATKTDIIETYILQRTLKGIQALKDTFKANGTRERQQRLNSTNKAIKQLKGKTNVLTRTIEETRLEMSDIESGLSSRITANASSITAEVSRATTAEGNLSSRISVAEGNINLKVSKDSIINQINISQESVAISGSKISIQGATFINDWVIDSGGIHNNLPYTGQKNSNATGMGSYGSDWAFWAGNGKFSVNQSGKLVATDAEITGTITATSGSFSGTVNASSGTFSGTVNASSGTFDNVTINSSCNVAGQSITGDIGKDGTNWTGNVFSDGKIPCLSNGVLNRALSIDNLSVSSSGINYSGSSNSYLSSVYTSTIMPKGEGTGPLGNIGNSGRRFNFYGTLYGTVSSSSSSREVKSNISAIDTDMCLPIILNTEIVRYNYNEDLTDIAKEIAEKKRQKENAIKEIRKYSKEKYTEQEMQTIAEYNEEIASIKNRPNTVPEWRYGFISEDAPWELVAKDRKSVDTYSAVAMCFGAIQKMHERIKQLEEGKEVDNDKPSNT